VRQTETDIRTDRNVTISRSAQFLMWSSGTSGHRIKSTHHQHITHMMLISLKYCTSPVPLRHSTTELFTAVDHDTDTLAQPRRSVHINQDVFRFT